MKTKTVNIYSASELREHNPERFEQVKKAFLADFDIPWFDETIESYKAFITAIHGVELSDWSIGIYSYRNFAKIVAYDDDVLNLTGKRAFAWIENNLLHDLREPYSIQARLRKHGTNYLKYHKANAIPSCPFTGYYMDDVLLEELTKAIKDGRTFGEALTIDCLDIVAHHLESESDYYHSDEGFIEHADANGYEWDEYGNMQ